MNNIILLPQAQRVNNIEDAVILDEFKAENHFIEANTQEVTFEHLKNDCITPVFAKDNELTINHADFIETIEDATRTFFHGQKVGTPNIRVSHVIKGRIPEAVRKPASQLLDSDKTIYYERAAFSIDIPTVFETIMGNKLNLSLGYSHPVDMVDPEGITTTVDGNKIIVSGIDKEKVGQYAAEIREKRAPEPYKGKGIKYSDEVIRRKVGKTGKK